MVSPTNLSVIAKLDGHIIYVHKYLRSLLPCLNLLVLTCIVHILGRSLKLNWATSA